MADHKMFERVKKLIALQAPTRNISTPAAAFGKSMRNAARNYASVGVVALFVSGVASPAVLAGADEEAAGTVSMQPSSVVAQQSGSADRDAVAGGKVVLDKGNRKPSGGGAPAPRSDDPAAHDRHADEKAKDDKSAEKSAESDAKEASGGGAQPASAPEPVDEVDGWIRTAIDVMQDNGVPVSEKDIPSIRTVIEKESSGNPRAINLWDINAKRGIPSKGLMQTIDPTFQAYKLPGYEDIYDPVSNIIAGVRYTLSRYGSFEKHPGLASMASGGSYRGY